MPRRITSKIHATTATALILAVVLSSVVLATDTPKERTQPRSTAARPFVPSEELVYEGEFTKMLLRGIDIAELRFKALRPTPYRAGDSADVRFDPSLYLRYREYRAALGLLVAWCVLWLKAVLAF